MTTTTARIHPLQESVEKHKIRRVAVVDDAFDAVSLDSLQEGEAKEFMDAINEHDTLLKEFHTLVSGNDSADLLKAADLTDAAVKRLWDSRTTLAGLAPVVSKTLFRVLDLKVFQVETLCTFLKNDLEIADDNIQRYGTKSDMPNAEFDIAFIDYRFGPSRQKESVDRAVRWAMHLYKKGQTFIILMSSDPEAHDQQDKFRSDSKLTRGLFEFVDKKEITDHGKFCNRLNSFCAGLNTRHEIHQFATAAETAVEEAVAALKESIHALGLEDYAYLEQISLREDGHPLGDYMLWLFGEYFGHKLAVNTSLQPARKLVNGLRYERFLPLQRPPSVMLAKMYSAAITEPVHEGWNPHPREVQETADATVPTETAPAGTAAPATQAPTAVVNSATPDALSPRDTSLPSSPTLSASAQPPEEPQATADAGPHAEPVPPQEAPPSMKGMPLYQLGDLLVADKDKPAFLILNAGCDLQFSPGNRDCDPQQTILLVPGRFEPLHERGDEKNVKRTELFELGEERFRIIWQHAHVRGMPYYKVRSEHEPEGYDRKWRLKLPYALEVQQHFAAQLTRVGVPTPTPVFRERPVEVYGRDAGGNCQHLGAVRDGIIVFHHRDRDQFVLTVDCLHEVLDHIDRFALQVAAEIRTEPGAPVLTGDPAKKAARRKKYLDELRASRETLAHTCNFQDSLCDLPAINGVVNQIEEISKTEKPVRLEIKHAATLTGRFPGNAPIILTFSLPDVVTDPLAEPNEQPTSPGGSTAEPTSEEMTQP